ncbi:hypothetical protein ACFQ6S_41625 [Streptomyces sp. NPDC056479]|uniref:hypothetical protein n=1 Tax=Streptomyces sp. NPDC056479 TaxID=3345832 RepID=UPI0036B7AE34
MRRRRNQCNSAIAPTAVVAGLTLASKPGVVEGHVNRIKMLKRQIYGRAGSQLLWKRVLLAL